MPRTAAPQPEPALIEIEGHRTPAALRAETYLRELLFDGHVRPGDQIDQDEIAAALGISRQPVREAVLELAGDGLLVIRPRKGVYVGRFDAKVVRGHYELNGHIEAFAAAKVARDPHPLAVEQLRLHLAAMRKHTDPILIERASLAFYWTINVASDNPRIGDALRVLQRFVPSPVYVRYPRLIANARLGSARVLSAIERGDPDDAGAACVEQWTAGGEIVLRDLISRGVIDRRE